MCIGKDFVVNMTSSLVIDMKNKFTNILAHVT